MSDLGRMLALGAAIEIAIIAGLAALCGAVVVGFMWLVVSLTAA